MKPKPNMCGEKSAGIMLSKGQPARIYIDNRKQ